MKVKPRTTSNTPMGRFILANQRLAVFQTPNLEHIKEKVSRRLVAGLATRPLSCHAPVLRYNVYLI